MEAYVLTSFYSVFEQSLQNQKQQLKEEYKKSKSERRKTWMKQQIAEAKDMRNHLKEMKSHMKTEVCPHCGEKIQVAYNSNTVSMIG